MTNEERDAIRQRAAEYASSRVKNRCEDDCLLCWKYRFDMPCEQYELMTAYMAGAGAFETPTKKPSGTMAGKSPAMEPSGTMVGKATGTVAVNP